MINYPVCNVNEHKIDTTNIVPKFQTEVQLVRLWIII